MTDDVVLGADAAPDIGLMDAVGEWCVPTPEACAYVHQTLQQTVRDLDWVLEHIHTPAAPKGIQKLQKRIARLGRIMAGEALSEDAKHIARTSGLIERNGELALDDRPSPRNAITEGH